MPTLIQQLATKLDECQGAALDVRSRPDSMLVTIRLGNGRRQTVKVTLASTLVGSEHVLHFQSRACVAENHAIVRYILQGNSAASLAGFVLDTSTSPPVVDVTYGLVASRVEFHVFVQALESVARLADAIEQETSSEDVF